MNWDEIKKRYLELSSIVKSSRYQPLEEKARLETPAGSMVVHEYPADIRNAHINMDRIAKDTARRLWFYRSRDIMILTSWLKDDHLKWFVAMMLGKKRRIPKTLLDPMIQAAVQFEDPDDPKWFIRPCVKAFGHRVVMQKLIVILKTGSDYEKTGAVQSLFFAGPHLTYRSQDKKDKQGKPFGEWTPTRKSLKQWNKVADLRTEIRNICLKEFVSNGNLELRRYLITGLKLEEEKYPEELKPLVPQAITIARNHSDEYIRHTVEIKLGKQDAPSHLMPLPSRLHH